jgi:uncharacterized damage-inducible protein DinB
MPGTLDRLFLEHSINTLRQYESRIETCLGLLNEEQVWARGGGNENAVGNLVLHLCGNVRQWIVSGAGGRPDHRDRDAEFAARGGAPIATLELSLKSVVSEAADVIGALTPERLSERIVVQGYDVSVLEGVYHAVEHFSMHTGQIIFITKMLTGEDLGFYKHLSGAGREVYPTNPGSSAAGTRTPTKNDPNSA